MNRPVRRSLAAVVAAAALVSCGAFGGDRGLPIAFVNTTDENVILYEKGRANPAYRKELAPNSRTENVWVDSRLDDKAKDFVKYRVEATTRSGEVVFCHDYTFNELTRIGWVVQVRRHNDCGT